MSRPAPQVRRGACQTTVALLRLLAEGCARDAAAGGHALLPRAAMVAAAAAEGAAAGMAAAGTVAVVADGAEALAESERLLTRCAESGVLEQRIEAQRALLPPLLALLPPPSVDALACALIGGLDAEWSGAASACVALDGLLPHAHAAGGARFVRSVLISLLDVLPRVDTQYATHTGAAEPSTRCSRPTP